MTSRRLWYAVLIACAMRASSLAQHAPQGNMPALPVMGRTEKEYLEGLYFVHRQLRSDTIGLETLRQHYGQARARWLGARFKSDSTAQREGAAQSAWPRDAKAPPPTLGCASWILALHAQGFGVLGAARLSWAMAEQVDQRQGVVFLESQEGYRWVKGKQRSGKARSVILSDGTIVQCGKNPRKEVCSIADSRQQWFLVFPRVWQACAFLNGTRELSRSARCAVFWYPVFLEEYLVTVSGRAGQDLLPSVPRFINCD